MVAPSSRIPSDPEESSSGSTTLNVGDVLARLGVDCSRAHDDLLQGRKSIVPVHLGQTDVTIRHVLNTIKEAPHLTPPRTGHLGNWSDIALSRSGALDFNSAICDHGYGYPLIYPFTRTEAHTPGGDDVYSPGSVIFGGRRTELQLRTWDGVRFVERDRTEPIMCALAQADVDGVVRPLVTVQEERMRLAVDYPFTSWASLLWQSRDLVVPMLTGSLETAASEERSQALADIISHSVGLDGSVTRGVMMSDERGFVLDGHRFSDAQAVAEGAMALVQALTEPDEFFARMEDLPPRLPVISLPMSTVLFALLRTHRSSGSLPLRTESPYLAHLHWGARAMAGAPPGNEGYVMRKNFQRTLRRLIDPHLGKDPRVQSTAFIVLPATVFMLWPAGRSSRDVELVEELIADVRAGRDDVASLTAAWWERRQSALSEYMRMRFVPGVGVPRHGDELPASSSVEPAGFMDLTWREATTIVSTLMEFA